MSIQRDCGDSKGGSPIGWIEICKEVAAFEERDHGGESVGVEACWMRPKPVEHCDLDQSD